MYCRDGRTVVVVDDEPVITDLLRAVLASEGFDCRCASSAPEALGMLADCPAAFVLTDVRMPGMSGLDLLEQVRNHHPDTFVLLLTGAADVAMVTRAFRAGACDFLTKPFSMDELRSRMSTAVEQRGAVLKERESTRLRDEALGQLAGRHKVVVEGVVTSLTTILGTKHPQTRAHSERVAIRAANVALCLGLADEEIDALYTAGLLHDIGKVAVDSTILEKSGRLDVYEFDQIRAHPAESARIVDPIDLPTAVAEAIRHHHERFDGTGYPDGLAGEGIPLGARILAVCDAYDAMTSDRAYSPALPVAEGLARLREGAGAQWDASVVEAVMRLEADTQGLTLAPVEARRSAGPTAALPDRRESVDNGPYALQ